MDKKYWDEFYKKNHDKKSISSCSSFAKFCQDKFFLETFSIVELGCGNARDSFYFAEKGHNVIAIDQSISEGVREKKRHKNIEFFESDFVAENYDSADGICGRKKYTLATKKAFYSRFTIHSITKQEEQEVLRKVYNALDAGGLFLVEARTTKDPKFGLGKHISDTTYYYDGHARRFIDPQLITRELLELGFKLKYFEEDKNLSVYRDDNPYLLRIVLEK